MITVDRDAVRVYVNDVCSECNPPYDAPLTDSELDVLVEMISEPSDYVLDEFFQWLDDERCNGSTIE